MKLSDVFKSINAEYIVQLLGKLPTDKFQKWMSEFW